MTVVASDEHGGVLQVEVVAFSVESVPAGFKNLEVKFRDAVIRTHLGINRGQLEELLDTK